MPPFGVDKAGRVVLPKTVRDELKIEAGDTLELESDGERVMLRRSLPSSRRYKKRGIWVFRSGQPMPAGLTDKVLHEIREQRDKDVRGENLPR